MNRVLGWLRRPWVRGAFVVAAVAAAVVAVVGSWEDVVAAVDSMDPRLLAASAAAAPAYVAVTMLCWRSVLTDLGSRMRPRDAYAVFFLSQLGKYLPGSVWNVVAAAEMGADRQVPRRRSLAAMGVTMLLSLATGMGVGAIGLALAPSEARDRFWIALLAVPVLAILVVPAVTNRLANLALKVLRRPPLERGLGAAGTASALGWSIAGWLVAGTHVWLLAVALGLPATLGSYLLCTGGYALAWSVGFLALPLPAGVGAREVVLVAVLSSTLDKGSVLVVVLMSRVLLTAADLALAGVAGALELAHQRHRGRAGGPSGGEDDAAAR